MNRKLLVALALLVLLGPLVSAQEVGTGTTANTDLGTGEQALRIPFVNLEIREPGSNQEVALSLQLLLLLGILSLAPSFIIIMTSFLRISIVFDFVRRALSLQQVPPAQVLMGISLFLTMFIMWPTFTQIYENAFVPFSAGDIGME
ncbi:MAG: flagellar biosynthetic protein FliP, partial [Spirochaetales bacterium]